MIDRQKSDISCFSLTLPKRTRSERSFIHQSASRTESNMSTELRHPDLRLVLVGSQIFGEESVANTILGGETFDWGQRPAHSVTHEGLVEGKVIRLVKAPVWLRGYHLCDTSELVKEELRLSVTQCPPGPHAFILLVEVDLPFTSACAQAVEEHLQLYGDKVWSHTLVLFTCVDWLGRTTISQYIQGEGSGLSQLLQRCGNRFYTFDKTKTSEALSQELLRKVEELVKHNQGGHFEIEENVLQRIKEKRDEVKRKAEARHKENKAQKNTGGAALSELTIVLLGWVFSKKSALGNVILGIRGVEGRTETCVKETRVVGERGLTVTVVDTPGWWKYFSANLVPKTVQSEIMKAVNQDENQAFLLMVPADTSFTNEQRKIIEDNMKRFGEKVWENTLVVFSRAFRLGRFPIEEHIEREGEALTWLVEKCGNRYLVYDDEKEEDSQVLQLLDKVEDMLKEKKSQRPSPHTKPDFPPSTAETEEHAAAGVDEDLQKMVEVLYRVWGWGSWETEQVRRRFAQRRRSMDTPPMGEDASKLIRLNTYHNREEMEKVLKEETQGRSLEELMKIALQVYFRKQCGVFDIVSIISEKDTFNQEWKKLFQREWARRELRLMEHVAQTCSMRETDSDLPEPGPKTMKETIQKVSAWLDGVGTEDVSEEWISDQEEDNNTDPNP